MDVAEILRRSNQASLDSLVPLIKIQTRTDMKRYAQNGYSVGITAKEFSEKYPLLPIENIYFSDNLFDTLYYGELDFEMPIVLNLQIYGNKRLAVKESDEEFQKRVLATVANIKTLDKNKLSCYINSLSDGLSMSVLAAYVKRTKPSAALYDFFFSFYKYKDYGFAHLDLEDFEKVVVKKSEKAKNKTAEKTKALPDVVTIYRGEGDDSTPYTNTFSWTTSLQIATFFACRFPSPKDSRIITATIPKSAIIEYFPDAEKEVIVSPSSIKNEKIQVLYGIDSVGHYYSAFDSLYQTYRRKMKRVYMDNNSSAHDATHTLRVLFDALMVVYVGEYNLTQKDLKRLCDAILYHDVGRINEDVDDLHGAASAKIYEKEVSASDAITSFLVQYHCIDDNISMQAMKSLGFKAEEKVKLLYNILKDADALDRTRFGMKDVDPTYFRLPVSIQLLPTAQLCVGSLEL